MDSRNGVSARRLAPHKLQTHSPQCQGGPSGRDKRQASHGDGSDGDDESEEIPQPRTSTKSPKGKGKAKAKEITPAASSPVQPKDTDVEMEENEDDVLPVPKPAKAKPRPKPVPIKKASKGTTVTTYVFVHMTDLPATKALSPRLLTVSEVISISYSSDSPRSFHRIIPERIC